MSTITPTFSGENDAATPPRADFIEVDRALESMRDAGFDLMAAVGEPIDNSIEAGARTIRIAPTYSSDKKRITAIAFADDGQGIDPNVLPSVLKMGYSTRYNQRQGLGRFGVGLKLAALSVGTRIEIYTKPAGSDQHYHAFLDLNRIKDGTQEYIEAVPVDGWPTEYASLMASDKGVPFENGTMVLWADIDRLTSGGPYGKSLDQRLDELRKFIARAYREFIDRGLIIALGDTVITLHDPLFLKDNPRLLKQYKGRPDEEVRGRVIEEVDLPIDNHPVHVTVSLVPELFRHKQGAGGDKDADGRDIRQFQINQTNAGRVSMMRNGREIYYDIVPRLLPAGVDKIDRYIGIEVSFPAELDGYFQVRHVKRGAEPVDKLRNDLREWLERPINSARKEIRKHWQQAKVEDLNETGRNDGVLEAVDRAEQLASTPKGQAGFDVTEEDQEQIIAELLEDLNIDPNEGLEKANQIRAMIKEHPITIVDGAWPGKELMEIDHLNNRAVVRLNHRHPFIRDVYDPLREVSTKLPDGQDAADLFELIQKTSNALDVLFLAYAKAENMHRDPSIFDDLRSYWGQHTQAYMKELAKDDE